MRALIDGFRGFIDCGCFRTVRNRARCWRIGQHMFSTVHIVFPGEIRYDDCGTMGHGGSIQRFTHGRYVDISISTIPTCRLHDTDQRCMDNNYHGGKVESVNESAFHPVHPHAYFPIDFLRLSSFNPNRRIIGFRGVI